MRVALYARVSRADQQALNQLLELREYSRLRGWSAEEFVDSGVSGAKERRPALDRLLKGAMKRRFDLLLVWRLDRLGRNLRHLITLIDDLSAVGIGFVSLGESIDTTSPSGRLALHVLGALAEFERARTAERVRCGIARARAQGKRLGRPRKSRPPVSIPTGLTVRLAASLWGISKSTAARWISEGRIPQHAGQSPAQEIALSPDVH